MFSLLTRIKKTVKSFLKKNSFISFSTGFVIALLLKSGIISASQGIDLFRQTSELREELKKTNKNTIRVEGIEEETSNIEDPWLSWFLEKYETVESDNKILNVDVEYIIKLSEHLDENVEIVEYIDNYSNNVGINNKVSTIINDTNTTPLLSYLYETSIFDSINDNEIIFYEDNNVNIELVDIKDNILYSQYENSNITPIIKRGKNLKKKVRNGIIITNKALEIKNPIGVYIVKNQNSIMNSAENSISIFIINNLVEG